MFDLSNTSLKRSLKGLFCLVAFACVMGVSNTAEAQKSTVTPDVKGVVGLALLGGELGLFLPAVLGAKDTWMYIVFPAVGAIGGGIGGYFLEQNTRNDPGIAISFLVGGALLVIPTLVGSLALMSYDENAEQTREKTVDDGEVTPTGQTMGMFQLNNRGLFLSAPALSFRSRFTNEEMSSMHLNAQVDLHLTLFSASF